MISLTPLAAAKVRESINKRGHGLGIKVGVRTTGCSGLAYTLEYIDEPKDELISFDSNGVKIYTDPRSLVYVDGMIMDWRRTGLNEGFDFINSKEKDRCGCGESFRV